MNTTIATILIIGMSVLAIIAGIFLMRWVINKWMWEWSKDGRELQTLIREGPDGPMNQAAVNKELTPMDDEIKRINNECKVLPDEAQKDPIKSQIPYHNASAFYDMKSAIARKLYQMGSAKQLAKKLDVSEEEVAEFEQYYSDPTLSDIQLYACLAGLFINIQVTEEAPNERQ